ncbi:uncharacterized protein AC631_03173 [Debaryomyces fabryi]|uniref:Uncharacterized protein n=1 Tax=Debaryomyces fabryi TaxID=58627 RepID=A0A0V1PXT1_9ASCO|nr:uncharacterized protein AC631_03173 [Debaryomyces fabryi]KSA01049.1 hypothetical protein AC631_03173 [Debaryomyces fabryi]CUM47620.1 unnamed protein product [Debaryomyces fabryi]
MESTRLENLIENTFIPPNKPKSEAKIPNYHPCLIVQDSQTDVNKLKPCGCYDNFCIKNASTLIPRSRR